MDEVSLLEKALAGKVVAKAQLERGTVVLNFTDGTSFEREKTYEGVITGTLRDKEGAVLHTARI